MTVRAELSPKASLSGLSVRRFARNAREPSSRAPTVARSAEVGQPSVRRRPAAIGERISPPARKPRFALAYALYEGGPVVKRVV
jgi:hypothetical protein